MVAQRLKMFVRFFIMLLACTVAIFGSVGRITVLSGNITIERGSKKERAVSNYLLEEKDVVASGAGATAQIIFNDKTVITVGSATNFKIEEYLFGEKDAKARFSVGEGTFKTITGKIGKIAPEKFKVETKTATIGIRGTIFLGSVDKSGTLTVACTKGAISVTPNIPAAPPVIVNQGQMTRADTKGVEPPKAFTPQDMKNLEKSLTTDKKAQSESGGGSDRQETANGSASSSKQATTAQQTTMEENNDKPIIGISEQSDKKPQVSLNAVEKSVSGAKDAVVNAQAVVNNAVVDDKLTKAVENNTPTASTTTVAEATVATTSATSPVAADYSYLTTAKNSGDLSVLGSAKLSSDSAVRSAVASVLSDISTAGGQTYTVIPSDTATLLNNALKVTYEGTTKYFKYSGNTNTYGTDETFSSISELITKLQTFTGSAVKFYLDPSTNKISYGTTGVISPYGTGGAGTFSLAKVDQANDFLGFANTPLAQTGSLNAARGQFGITKITTGSYAGNIMIFGGYNDTAGSNISGANIVEMYNPSSGLWTVPTTTGTTTNSRNVMLTTLPNGKVLALGGYNDTFGGLSTVQQFDPVAMSWSTLANMPSVAAESAVAKTSGGMVYVFGTWDSNSAGGTADGKVMKYDYTNGANGTWTYATQSASVLEGAAAVTFGANSLNTAGSSLQDKILVFGGVASSHSGTATNLAQMFDPSGSSGSGSWSTMASMLSPRAYFTGTLLQNGNVLAIGGESTVYSTLLSSMEEYNPSTNSWHYKVPLPTTLSREGAITLDNGSVLIVGGKQISTAVSGTTYIYTPSSDPIRQVASMPGFKTYSNAVRLTDGSVIVVGGEYNVASGSVYKYDPTSGAWSTAAALTGRAGYGAAMAPLSNGTAMIIGGYTDATSYIGNAVIYNPATGIVSTSATNSVLARQHAKAVTMYDGNVLYFGGRDISAPNGGYLSSAYLIASNLSSVTATGSMGTARAFFSAAVSNDGKTAYAFGGWNGSAYISSAEKYNYTTNLWSGIAAMPVVTASSSAVTTLDNKMLVFGGGTAFDSGFTNAVLEYDPAYDTWKYKVPLPVTFANGATARLTDGSVLVVGGQQNGSESTNAYIYNPTQTISSNINTILANDYNAGINNGFFIGASGATSKIVGSINSMLFSSEPSAAGLSINANSGQLSGALGSLSGITNAASNFDFSHYSAPSTSMVNYVGEDNKIIWGASSINGKAGMIGFASLPDRVDSVNTLSNVNDFSSWGYWEAKSSDATEYYAGYWVSGQPTPDLYIQQMISQNQTYNYVGHVLGDTLNASNVKDSIVFDNNNKLGMSVNFGQSNPIKVNSLSFKTSQGWSYVQNTNLTSASPSLTSANGYTATIGNSVNTSDILNIKGKFYGPQANSTGGVFAGQLTGTDTSMRGVQGVFKALR